MKVLLLNYIDSGGGAAQASVRLARQLKKQGINVTLGVTQKTTNLSYVIKIPSQKKIFSQNFWKKNLKYLIKIFSLFQKYFKLFLPQFKTTNPIMHSTNLKSSIDVNWINNSDYDIIHLHWINLDMISIKDIARIKKPLVWTLHDSWVACGAEHHPNILENDVRYQEGYFKYNKPKSTKGFDICKKIWDKKKKYLSNKNITFIAPSKWQAQILETSALFKGKKCHVIPNILNSLFTPLDKKHLKQSFQIPKHKIVLGFGAADTNDKNKGAAILQETLQKIENPEQYLLISFGFTDSSFINSLNIETFNIGWIQNQNLLNIVYNVCDVFICPSIIENLPYTCLESIFCGVPVVAFNTGGIPDIIEHNYNGYLATPFDSQDLATGIQYCIKNQKILAKNCLQKAKNDFDCNNTAQKHIELYQTILGIDKVK